MKNLALLLALLLVPGMTFASQFSDADALKGLKTVKVVCDVNVGKPKLLLRRLELIDETYTQLIISENKYRSSSVINISCWLLPRENPDKVYLW